MAAKVFVLLGIVACLGVGAHKFTHPAADLAANMALPQGAVTTPAPSTDAGGVVHARGLDLATRSRFIDLEDYRGRPVILNVWGSWCEACVAEGPAFAKLEQERPDMLIIGVDINDTPTDALAAMQGWQWTHESIWDPRARWDSACRGTKAFRSRSSSTSSTASSTRFSARRPTTSCTSARFASRGVARGLM